MKNIFILLLAVLPVAVSAQQQTTRVGSKVKQVMIRDSNDNPVPIPEFGKKHLLIFYPDPDHGNQNKSFTDYLEDNHIISDQMYCFGIVNLKDAPLMPNSLIRSIIHKKEKKNDVVIYTDPDHILRDAWGLGDVNNLFTIILVTKDCEIAYLKKGKMSRKDIDEFFEVVEKYK